jgi:hypothetical protein
MNIDSRGSHLIQGGTRNRSADQVGHAKLDKAPYLSWKVRCRKHRLTLRDNLAINNFKKNQMSGNVKYRRHPFLPRRHRHTHLAESPSSLPDSIPL